MSKNGGMTLLEVLVTIVIVAIGATLLVKLSAETWIANATTKRLMVAGHAIQAAVERERIRIAADPGAARTPLAEPVAGNFPEPGKTWNDTDAVNNIIVACSVGVSKTLDGTVLENVRTLSAKAIIFSGKRGEGIAGMAVDTLVIKTCVSRFF